MLPRCKTGLTNVVIVQRNILLRCMSLKVALRGLRCIATTAFAIGGIADKRAVRGLNYSVANDPNVADIIGHNAFGALFNRGGAIFTPGR